MFVACRPAPAPLGRGWNASVGTAYPSAALPSTAAWQSLYSSVGSPVQAQWLAADLASVAASPAIDWRAQTRAGTNYYLV